MNSANEIVDHCLLQYTIDRLTNLFIYRKVFCPAIEKNCQSNTILLKDVSEHLETSHNTIDEGSDDIIASGLLLNVGINAVKTTLNEEKKFGFEITIRNLKEEAKDDDVESGVSDGE